MPQFPPVAPLAVSGPESEEGRRPTMISGPETASPELSVRPVRRTLTADYKLRILAEVDKAAGIPGGIGAITRREGLYSSALTDWRRLREAGALGALGPVKRGPKAAEPNPLSKENAQLLRENKRLARQLERAEIVIDVQKKVAALLGLPPLSDEEP